LWCKTHLTHEEVRTKLLGLISRRTQVTRRWLSRQFSSRDRIVFNEALGRLFADGTVVKVGLGRKGSPQLIVKRQNT
jgi:hypothetical protein